MANAIRKTAASRLMCESPGPRRSSSSPTRSNGKSGNTVRARSHSRTARIIPGGMSVTTFQRCYALRVGQSETYGTVEDCLQNCDMIVFWAADPESTSGSYGAQEGTTRRQWLKDAKLGIKVVHVDPYYNASAQFLPGKWFAPKPTTSVAMAMAIAYVWIKEGLYDKAYVETHTVGFDKWKAYLLGEEDGVPKTPEWQEKETGVPAKDVRALAREWGRKRVYLAPGGWGNGHGGACRNQ